MKTTTHKQVVIAMSSSNMTISQYVFSHKGCDISDANKIVSMAAEFLSIAAYGVRDKEINSGIGVEDRPNFNCKAIKRLLDDRMDQETVIKQVKMDGEVHLWSSLSVSEKNSAKLEESIGHVKIEGMTGREVASAVPANEAMQSDYTLKFFLPYYYMWQTHNYKTMLLERDEEGSTFVFSKDVLEKRLIDDRQEEKVTAFYAYTRAKQLRLAGDTNKLAKTDGAFKQEDSHIHLAVVEDGKKLLAQLVSINASWPNLPSVDFPDDIQGDQRHIMDEAGRKADGVATQSIENDTREWVANRAGPTRLTTIESVMGTCGVITLNLVIVSCELDIIGYLLGAVAYWKIEAIITKVLIVLMPIAYFVVLVARVAGLLGKPMDGDEMKPFHFLPMGRLGIIMRPGSADKNDVLQLFRVNTLSTLTLGISGILSIAIGLSMEQLSIDSVEAQFSLSSLGLSVLVTILYFTPLLKVIQAMAEVEKEKTICNREIFQMREKIERESLKSKQEIRQQVMNKLGVSREEVEHKLPMAADNRVFMTAYEAIMRANMVSKVRTLMR
jgi:hypothetical protein